MYRHSITNPIELCKQGMFPIGFSHARWNNFLHKKTTSSLQIGSISRERMLFFFPRETNPTGQRESQAPLPELSGTFCLLGVFSMP